MTRAKDISKIITDADFSGTLDVTGVSSFANGTNSAPSLTFTSDTNTGIYRGGTDILKFVTAGTDAITIDASQNVDVNGTVTSDGLTVDGTADVDSLVIDNAGKISSLGQIELQVDTDNNQSGTYIGFSRNNTTSQRLALFSENGDISFYEDTGTTPKFVWDASTERLGLGISTPSGIIQAVGVADAANGSIMYSASGVASGYFSANANGLCLATDTAGITFRTGITGAAPTTTGTERMRITSSGYVEMASASQVRLTLGSEGTAGSNTANWIRGNGTSLGFNSASGGFQWEIGGGERMRIDSSGNVGIGITPTRKLHVGGTGSGQGELHLTNDTTGHGVGDGSTFTTSGSDLLILQRENANTRFYTNGTEHMRLQADGTLSIGTTNDTNAKLYVLNSNTEPVTFIQSGSNGNDGVIAINTSINQNAGNTDCQHLKSTTQNVGTFKLNGNGSSTFSSDERLKKNIETTRDGYLEDLAKLRVVKYNWHCHDDSTDKELGLIAQEVQKVFPKLIVEDDVELNGIEKPLAIKNSVLPMMLLKALQEANTKITALEARITALETA